MARRAVICYLRTSQLKAAVLYDKDEKFPVPGLKVLRQGANDRVTVIGAGVAVTEALKAYEELKSRGIGIRVLDLYCVKPLDITALSEQVRATAGRLVTVE